MYLLTTSKHSQIEISDNLSEISVEIDLALNKDYCENLNRNSTI